MSQAHIPSLSRQAIQQLSQHLFPPTAAPIPKHLLSTPLLQRHHFLAISPQDPVDYLCWPSPDSPSVIEQLSAIHHHHLPLDHLAHQTVYSADSETTLARVPVHWSDCHLQLIFLHDPEDPSTPWKYHDTQLFSPLQDSYPTVEAALHSIPIPPEPQDPQSMDTLYLDTAEAFWDGYSSSGHSSPAVEADKQEPTAPQSAEEKAERDYWSQYSAVKGTADSTIPSPRVPRNASSGGLEISWSGAQPNYRVVTTRETPSHQEIAKVLTGISGLQLSVPQIEITSGPPEYVEENAERDATEAALHAIFRMWRMQNPSADKGDFMSLVERAIR